MTFAAHVLDALGPAFRERAGVLLADVVEGLTAPVEPLDAALTPTANGWPTILDVETTADPRWLGIVTGTPMPRGLTTEQARAYLRQRSTRQRGTPGALIAAVQPLLTGTRRVDLIERDGSPWRLRVITFAQQSGGTTQSAIAAAVATQKPVGLVATVEVREGASYGHLRDVHGPTYGQVRAAFPTYAAARTHYPEDGTRF